ncbi:SDR family oxidoreductase [Crenobacter caeni]|uniref:SDR family NAD(P)-dependent oxidoreductase n=1 Tax=Crenobacter caeni TaxID=2705474 RepID=A0A6B2KUU8_9NEIS|nr:SDR family oxidoreductase [Crenobacter caeni]NDV13783.1 SDR family NAD(P)-dependent oxidoreductase [Crenobacter caeni]
MQLCENRTVIITGAGGGLGRAYALALAAAGANVVVNDIRLEAAQAVVADILASGGKALVNAGDICSLEGARAIVAAALTAFGEVHAVVNNAGILRDRMFVSLSEEDWDAVMRVHLKGHFCLARVLAERWRNLAKDGIAIDARIINTTSGAGLQGSIGQSNYASAKGGVAALTLVQAAELRRYGVTANALAPAARTSMTEQGMPDLVKKPDSGFDHYDPANVAPLVVWLASSASRGVSGQVFEIEGDRVSVCDGWRSGPEARAGGVAFTAQTIGPVIAGLIGEAVPAKPVWGS